MGIVEDARAEQEAKLEFADPVKESREDKVRGEEAFRDAVQYLGGQGNIIQWASARTGDDVDFAGFETMVDSHPDKDVFLKKMATAHLVAKASGLKFEFVFNNYNPVMSQIYGSDIVNGVFVDPKRVFKSIIDANDGAFGRTIDRKGFKTIGNQF